MGFASHREVAAYSPSRSPPPSGETEDFTHRIHLKGGAMKRLPLLTVCLLFAPLAADAQVEIGSDAGLVLDVISGSSNLIGGDA